MPNNRTHAWEKADFGLALEAAILSHAEKRLIRRRGGRIYFNGWWRGGKSSNVVGNTANGTWFDYKTSQTGGIVDFARAVFGVSLPAFMERFHASMPLRERRVEEPAEDAPDVASVWESICALPVNADVARWMADMRGVPVEHDEIGRGYVGLCGGDEGVIENEDARRWVGKRLASCGPSAVFPMRSATSGAVVNVHVRPIGGTDNRRFFPGSSLSDGPAPVAYGFPHGALGAPHLLLVEGAIDCLAATGALLDTDREWVVVGAASASCLRGWARWLLKKTVGDVIVVPHLDPVERGATGQIASARLVAALQAGGVPVRMFDWDGFHATLGGRAGDDVADLADAPRVFGWAAFRGALRGVLGVDR